MASTRRRFLGGLGRSFVVLLGAPAAAWARELAHGIHDATRNTLLGAVGTRLRALAPGGDPPIAHDFPGRERIPLGEPARTPALSLAEALDRHRPAPAFTGGPLPRETLDRLLHFTNGVTGGPPGHPLRAAPSAGALYAGEVYLVVGRVAGLAPGVYAFAPLEASLVALDRPRPDALDTVRSALADPAEGRGAAAAVLLTNVFRRYRHKYANRGYRYALVDSGHIGENLRLAATSAGVAERAPLRWEDASLNALLGVDGVEEAVCAVHLLGAAGEPETRDAAGTKAPNRALVEAWRADVPLPDAADDAPERYHARTRLVPAAEADVEPAAPTGLAPRRDPAEAAAEAVSLPAPPTPDATVEAVIGQRRSARRFQREPVAAADLAFVLDAAAGHPSLRRVPGLAIRLVVHRVDDLAPGLYAARDDARSLAPLRRADLADALTRACLGQPKAREAAVAFVLVGDLGRATRARGERAWRDLCLEAGAVAQRIYLAAEALGLAARNLAAFLDDDLNALVGLDGRDRAALHLTLLGPGD